MAENINKVFEKFDPLNLLEYQELLLSSVFKNDPQLSFQNLTMSPTDSINSRNYEKKAILN